jgi:DNA polymerase-1
MDDQAVSAAAALEAARAAGVEIHLDGDDLVLEAPAPPPDEILDLLSRHKPDIVALLQPDRDVSAQRIRQNLCELLDAQDAKQREHQRVAACEQLSLGSPAPEPRASDAAIPLVRRPTSMAKHERRGGIRFPAAQLRLDGPPMPEEAASIALLAQLNVTPVLVETNHEARAAVRQLIRDQRRHPDSGPIAIDLETTGLDPHTARIATLQLYAGGATALVFRAEALDLLLRTCWLRRQWLVAHNATFDAAFVQRHAIPSPKSNRDNSAKSSARSCMECTMQAAGLVLGVGNRSLVRAAKVLLDINVPKQLRMSDWSAARLSPGQIAYAAADAVVTRRLWPILTDAMRKDRTAAAYELQRDAVPAVVDMQLRGLGFDGAEHARQVDAWEQEFAEARQRYTQATGQLPPSKPNEIRAWLTEVLNPAALASWPRTPKASLLSVATDHLKRLTHVPVAREVLAILANAKLISTYGRTFAEQINPATGRLHAHYNIAGAKSGRLSCSDPSLHQLPSACAPTFRRCIIAATGSVLIGCDWNQIELRAAAWLSGDAELTALYAEGRDLHRETAAAIAGVPIEKVTPEIRQAAKAVVFGSVYGIGPRALAEDAFASYGIPMTEPEAKHALTAFFRRFATLDRWRQDNANLCERRGHVRIGVGRLVKAAWEPGGRISFPQACNLPVQGICADAMLRAIALVDAHFAQAGIRGGLVASVHDELLCEVVEADAEKAREILEQAMIDAFVATFPGAPTTNVATAKIGRSWADTKDDRPANLGTPPLVGSAICAPTSDAPREPGMSHLEKQPGLLDALAPTVDSVSAPAGKSPDTPTIAAATSPLLPAAAGAAVDSAAAVTLAIPRDYATHPAERLQPNPTGGYPRRSGYARVNDDFYVEPRWLVHRLLDVEAFEGAVHDPCCGSGTIPSVCLERGIHATGSDIVYRGFGEVRDLFDLAEPFDNFISNVPYKIAEACARRMLTLVRRKVALILPLTFWESRERERFFREHPPVRFWACGDRPSMPPGMMNGERDSFGAVIQPEGKGGKAPYGLFVFQRGFQGDTTARRLPLLPKQPMREAGR